jgi:hypothetical protein
MKILKITHFFAKVTDGDPSYGYTRYARACARNADNINKRHYLSLRRRNEQ